MSLSGRTAPSATILRTVAIRVPLNILDEFFLCLALFPARAVLTDDEIIRGMQHTEPPARRTLVIQFDSGRLVVILQHLAVMLQLINRRQFYAMAFELYSDPHFPGRVSAGDIAPAAP